MKGVFDDIIIEEEEGKNEPVIEEVHTQPGEFIDMPINHIAFIMDHSGSMFHIRDVARDSFNEQLAQIKKDSAGMENLVTVIEFDGSIKEPCIIEKNIHEVKDIKEYWIGGTTALYDAIATAIGKIELVMEDKGNHAALITIITDGYENASKEYTGDTGRVKLKSRIENLQATGKWTFVFMGADQNVMETAVAGMGIPKGNTLSYFSNDAGYKMSHRIYTSGLSGWSINRMGGVSGTNGTSGPSVTSGNSGAIFTSTTKFFEGDKIDDDKN